MLTKVEDAAPEEPRAPLKPFDMRQSKPWFLKARLKTRHLLLLLAIAEHGNIHRAAELLNMSQPAASKLLNDLEAVLGVTLFERLPRGTRPTWYGEALIRHARVAVASLSQAGNELEAIRSGRFGEVSVGAITAPAIGLLPQAMSILAREHPQLRVRLTVESSDVLLERLAQSKLDIMIGRLTGTQDKTNLTYERLADEPVCAVARAGHRMLDTRSLTLKQLERASWIVPPMGSVLRHRFELMFHEASLEVPTHLIETSSVLFMTKMLQQSDFLAVVPIDVARYYASYGMVAILPVELSCAMDDFGIILRNDWLLSPAGVVTLDALRTAAHHVFGTAPPAGKVLR